MLKEFTWGPVGKKIYRSDLRRHGNFFFPPPLKYFIQHTFLHLLSYVSLIVKGSFSKIGVLEKPHITFNLQITTPKLLIKTSRVKGQTLRAKGQTSRV
jgi:hypothetical protein